MYGLPPGSVRLSSQTEPRVREEWDSTPSLSPLNSDDLALDEDNSFSSTDCEEPLSSPSVMPSPRLSTSVVTKLPHSYQHRRHFEELHAKQYWRDDWHTDADLRSDFDTGDPSRLGLYLNPFLDSQLHLTFFSPSKDLPCHVSLLKHAGTKTHKRCYDQRYVLHGIPFRFNLHTHIPI